MWMIPESFILRQYLIIIGVNLSNLSLGFGLGWPSPVYVKLRDDSDLVLSRPITEDEGSWLASITCLAYSVCMYPTVYLAKRLGRKNSIIISNLPQLLACLLFLFGKEVWTLLLGRFLIGISTAFLFTIVPTFAAEIASKEIRGALGTIFQVCCSMGVFLSLCIGPFVSYLTLNVIYTVITVILTIPLIFLPESPYLLYSTGKIEESKAVLLQLRKTKTEVEEEIIEYNKQMEYRTNFSLRELVKNKVMLKAFAITIILAVGGQLSGFNAIQIYLQTILQTTETNIQPELASAVVGLLQLSASFFTATITDKFGRKPIMICSVAGMALGLFSLGTFFKLKDVGYEVKGVLNVLPLISIIVIMFCYSAGLGSIYFSIIAELFEGPARAVGVSSGLQICGLIMFITSKYFIYVISVIGAATTYWLFCGNCILTALFIAFYVPETKGKSFSKIQESLEARKNIKE